MQDCEGNMFLRRQIKKPALWLMLLVIPVIAGCDDEIAFFEYDVTWTADNPAPGKNAVTLISVLSDPDELLLAVDLYSIENGPTHGVYFDLVFRDEVMRYGGYEPGGLLEDAGYVNYQAAIDPQDPGRLIFGISLTGNVEVDAADGAVVYIRFIPRRSGTCPVTFENARIMTAESGGTRPVTGISWYGGYATIVD